MYALIVIYAKLAAHLFRRYLRDEVDNVSWVSLWMMWHCRSLKSES